MLRIKDLKTEYQLKPIGLCAQKPRFSWLIESDKKSTMQKNYCIVVRCGGQIVWDSGIVQSEQSIHLEYNGKPLVSCVEYEIDVCVCDNHGQEAKSTSTFETGFINGDGFTASWITHGMEDKVEASPIFCKNFRLQKQVKCARIYASALGVYNIHINGAKAGDAFLAPGWTSYNHRIQYQTYDISSLIKEENIIKIATANGWYSGELGFVTQPNHYGSRIAAIAQIHIYFEDGTSEIIVTDQSWRYETGEIRYSEIYHGETIDKTYIPAKDEQGVAVIYEHPIDILVGQEAEPVRVAKRVVAKKLIVTPKNEMVIDFGQNLVGVVEAKLNCPKGTKIVLKHAEVMDKNGNFYTENLRNARATDVFVCSGGDDVFMPSFTFHGFRYLMVEGLGEKVDAQDFVACVLHSDMQQTGDFACSHAGITQLQSNIQWGQRGNFLDVPTDCPQRDERIGWTGDAQVFASTAAYNMNVALFFTKWLKDLAAEQTEKYGVPSVVPNILGDAYGTAGWSDAATIIPWTMYLVYGDVKILENQYESMKAWVGFVSDKAGEKHLWQTGFQYGDWLALDKEEGAERTGATDVYLIATAFYAYSTDILAKTAKVLKKEEDAKKYEKLHTEIVNAFQKEYITATGRIVSETQTGCVLLLYMNLAKKEHRARILASLKTNIARHNNHLVTGFLGTPYILHVLSENGGHDLAGKIFLKQDFPSWLYAVNLGATTIWERWNSMLKDGSFDESGMNSFNHYAYGSVGSWMYEKLAGFQIIEPGYKKFRIAPQPIEGIKWVDAGIKTMYGQVRCRWELANGMFTVDIAVPPNTTAVCQLPDSQEDILLGSGSYHFEYATDMVLEIERYSVESSLGEILDNPIALNILKQYSPEIVDNPMIQFALDKSIADLVSVMPPEGVALFAEVIAQINNIDKQNNAADVL